MKRLAIPIAILVFGVVLLGGCFDPPATTDRIYIYPETTKATLDIPFYVYINSECITPIRGFETTISYNPDQVYVQEISWGLFFPKDNTFFSEPVIDNINGTVSKIFAVTIAMELVDRVGTILNIK